MAENAKERVLRYLVDAHAAEQGGLGSLQDLASQATDAQVRSAITEHITVTQSQIDRLKARIDALGGHDSAGKNFVNTVIAKASNLANAFHDEEDKQTQDVIKAYSFEYFEVGTYTALKAFAESVGDHETGQLAGAILSEEQLAGERLSRLIPQVATAAVKKTADVNVAQAQ